MSTQDLGQVVSPSMKGMIANIGTINLPTNFTGWTGAFGTIENSYKIKPFVIVTPILADADKDKIKNVSVSLEDTNTTQFAVRWEQSGVVSEQSKIQYIVLGF